MIMSARLGRLTAVALICLAPGCSSSDRRQPAAEQLESAPRDTIEVVEEFWPDGSPKLRKHVLLQSDGVRVDHGRHTLWYDNGQKEYEAAYDQGRLHGVEIAWHRNGEKWTEQYFDRGLRQGRRQTWDNQGRLRSEENYHEGRPHGVWTIWKGDGTIKWRAHFEHGKPAPK